MLSFDQNVRFRIDNTNFNYTARGATHIVQTGGVDAVTCGLAGEAAPGLSLGASINYWIDGLDHPYAWRELDSESVSLTFSDGTVVPAGGLSQDTFEHFRGANGSLGFLWRLDSSISLGGVWKWPFTAHVNHISRLLDDPTSTVVRARHRLQFPASYGLGLSWRPTDRLTFSSDLTYVDWGRFRAVDSAGTEYLVTGDPAGSASVDGVFTPRVGTEYLFLVRPGYAIATRGGVFYDPQPARGSSKSFFGGSLGIGLTFSSLSVDLAYQIRFGLDARNTSVATQFLDVANIPSDTIQNTIYLSLIRYF